MLPAVFGISWLAKAIVVFLYGLAAFLITWLCGILAGRQVDAWLEMFKGKLHILAAIVLLAGAAMYFFVNQIMPAFRS
jgi:hypothetical protein